MLRHPVSLRTFFATEPIRLPANEPAERGRRPLKYTIPGVEPRQLFGRFAPNCFRILPGIFNPTLYNRTH
jgi:hypothetical protein